MLIFPLKKEWYEKIRSGEKTVEYREVKPYWYIRLRNELEKKTRHIRLAQIRFAFFCF